VRKERDTDGQRPRCVKDVDKLNAASTEYESQSKQIGDLGILSSAGDFLSTTN
jgi:hypothetical protein